MHTKAFNKAQAAYELAKIITFVFWMPILAMFFLSFFIH
jgi:hypothetical protein